MGKRPSCPKEINKGAWSREEDETLSKYVTIHGEGKWQKVAQNAGLKRCGKSCRQRWLNYLKPGIKRGNISLDEEDMIIRLHRLLGNRWALIAKRLPGRTDNEIKNFWNTNLSKKLQKQPTSSSWPLSASLKHKHKLSASLKHKHKLCEVEKTKQIHVAPKAPLPRRVKVVQYNKILENKGYYDRGTSSSSSIKKDEASLTDFLIDIDEKNLKLPKIEDHNMVGLLQFDPTSSLTSDQCHLLTEKFDPLETLLDVDVELKWMASFLGLENE